MRPLDGQGSGNGAGTDLRIAYFISSYRGGAQLIRLVDRLRADDPGAQIVVHHDIFANPHLDAAELRRRNVHVIEAEKPIKWGDLTLEAARWRVFRWILANLDVDWVMLLSEQDYPVRPLHDLRSQISASGSDAIIMAQRLDTISDPVMRREMTNRYVPQWKQLPQLGLDRRLPAPVRAVTGRLRWVLYSAISRLQSSLLVYQGISSMGVPTRVGRMPRKPFFSADFPCWVNDCWFAASARSLRCVVDYVDRNPEFVQHYERTVIPLESATATILMNDPTIRVQLAATHAVRWSDRSTGRPDEFDRDDLDLLQASGKVFARKFQEGSAVLDDLDKLAGGGRGKAALVALDQPS